MGTIGTTPQIPAAAQAQVDAAYARAQDDELAEQGNLAPYEPGESGRGLTRLQTPKTVGIVSSTGGEEYVPWRLLDALKARNIQPVIVDPRTAEHVGQGTIDTHTGATIHLDGAITRIVPQGRSIDFVKQLEADGMPVLNGSHVHEVLTSKSAMRTVFRANGVPTIAGEHVVNTGADLVQAAQRFGTPLVLKPDDGREGMGIEKLADPDAVTAKAAQIDANRGVTLLAEPFVTTRPGAPKQSDVRVVTIGDEPIGAFRRVPASGDFRSNIAAGGHVEPVELTAEHRAAALAAHRAVGLDISGSDVYETEGSDGAMHAIIGEINRAPHLSDRDMGSIRVSDAVAELIARRL